MRIISRRIAQVLSLFIFFVLLLVGIFSKETFSFMHLPIIVLKAFIGYVIFWLIGIVISDIVLKAILTSVEDQKIETWEGGLLSKFSPEEDENIKKINVNRN